MAVVIKFRSKLNTAYIQTNEQTKKLKRTEQSRKCIKILSLFPSLPLCMRVCVCVCVHVCVCAYQPLATSTIFCSALCLHKYRLMMAAFALLINWIFSFVSICTEGKRQSIKDLTNSSFNCSLLKSPSYCCHTDKWRRTVTER